MPEPFALTGLTIVTGDAAGTTVADQTIVVGADGRIESVGATAEAAVPAGYKRVDMQGRYALPGLINAHAHLFADGKPLPDAFTNENTEHLVAIFMHSPVGTAMLRKRTKANVLTQLNSGVTTIRSLGDVKYEVVHIRDEIAEGKYVGPRILASGPLLATTGGHGTPTIALVSDDPWGARKNVRQNLRATVDVIKIAATGGVTDARALGEAGRPQMTEEEMAAICDEAHVAHRIVAAHAQSIEGVKRALRAGVDTIEHGCAMDSEMVDLFHDNPKSLHGTSSFVPTLMAALPLVKLDQSITGVGDMVKANGEMVLDGMIQGIRDAHDNGIRIGMGTDSALTYVTHYNTWREVDYVARYGEIGNAAALHAATQANAAMLGLDAVTGAIAEGLAADIVVVDANPLDDLRTLATPRAVVARGALLDAPKVETFAEIDSRMDTF